MNILKSKYFTKDQLNAVLFFCTLHEFDIQGIILALL